MVDKNRLTHNVYDKIITKKLLDETIKYGIIYGNDKLVFIKTGAGGTIKGYKDKYLKMADKIHKKLGATVICATGSFYDDSLQDKAIILETVLAINCNSFKLYLFGTSDGAYKNLLLAAQIPQTVKLLSVNSSFIGENEFIEKINAIPQIKKLFVYGTEDTDYQIVSLLKKLDCDNLEIITIDGADHKFIDMTEQYIGLIDLL